MEVVARSALMLLLHLFVLFGIKKKDNYQEHSFSNYMKVVQKYSQILWLLFFFFIPGRSSESDT